MKTKAIAWALAALLIAGVSAGTVKAGPITLTSGTYNVSAFVAKVTQTAGTTCPFFKNEVLTFELTYNGADKKAKARFPFPSLPAIVLMNLPDTPKVGKTMWGSSTTMYNAVVEPQDIPFSSFFQGVLSPTDTLSFVAAMEFANWPFTGTPSGNCDLIMGAVGTFAGPVD